MDGNFFLVVSDRIWKIGINIELSGNLFLFET